MPTLSASDYTRYLKFKAATVTPIRAAIQTRDNVALSQSIINANLLTSQAAFVTTPSTRTDTVLPARVTDVTSTPITTAVSAVVTNATGGGGYIEYTTSQAHGYVGGETVQVAGLTQNTLSVTPDQTGVLVYVSAVKFRIAVSATGTTTGTGRIVGRVYYTSSVAHGLAVGDVISITGLTTFSAASKAVLAIPTTTTFALDNTTTGASDTGATGSITGLVYYTTDIANGLETAIRYLSITGLGGFNVSLVPVYRVGSTTTFVIQSSATGTTTGASGILTTSVYTNTTTTLTSNARVQGLQVPQFRANPDAKSTVSFAGTSGALGSSRFQRPGGLPTGFKNSQSSYTRLPQSAGW
jgi:hypothetical protein